MKDLLYLKDDQIKEFIQLLYYAYRETFSDPREILSKKFFGPAHLRALHLMSSLSLVGLAIYQVWDGPKLAGKKDKMTSHGHWAYAYLGLLAATGIAGVLSGHFVERDSSGYQTAKRVHFGLAAGTTAAVTLTILHAPL